MNRIKWAVAIVAAAGVLSLASFLAPEHARAKDLPTVQNSWTNAIHSADELQLIAIYGTVVSERKVAIDALLPILSEKATERNRARMETAMRIAGAYRAAEAVDVLLDKIDFDELRPTTRPSAGELEYDTLTAHTLIEIGNPAIDGALERLSRESDKRRALAYAFVIKRVLGGPCAQLRLVAARDAARKMGVSTVAYEIAIDAVGKEGF